MCGSTTSPRFSPLLRRGRASPRQCRPHHRHSSLPRPRLLRAGHRALDSGRAGSGASTSPIPRSRRRSASSASRFPAASTPAAITMSAISAFSGSRRRARNPTRSPSAAIPAIITRSANCSAPACPPNRCPRPIDRVVAVYLARAPAAARASSKPIVVSASRRSRPRSRRSPMLLLDRHGARRAISWAGAEILPKAEDQSSCKTRRSAPSLESRPLAQPTLRSACWSRHNRPALGASRPCSAGSP